MQKAARRAGLAAPAVAVAGALAVAPQLHHPAVAADTVRHAPVSLAYQARLQDSAADDAAARLTFETYRTRPMPSPAGPARPATSAHRAAGRHRRPEPGASEQPSRTPAPAPLTCSGPADGMLPENYAAIVSFLTQHGYTGIAAAGVAGNIYQESAGNPESGGGLIGWTPLPAGYVTGNTAADLQTQLDGLITFDNQWAQYLPALNAATSAAGAAQTYMTYFERPGFPALANREAAATAVAQACGL